MKITSEDDVGKRKRDNDRKLRENLNKMMKGGRM